MSETAPLATPVLLASLVRELTLLVGQTLSLARTEVSAARREVSLAALGMAVSALVALFGALVLVAALVLIVVALGAPAWAATLAGSSTAGSDARQSGCRTRARVSRRR
jgi:hypothetical protein